jgi:hypothetical protein
LMDDSPARFGESLENVRPFRTGVIPKTARVGAPATPDFGVVGWLKRGEGSGVERDRKYPRSTID